MSARALAAALALASTAVAGCASAPMGGPPTINPGVFRGDDFSWSERSGSAAISGVITHRSDGRSYACAGSVGLTPDTPYTRNRIQRLYGAVERAAVPEADVRSRNLADPGEDYRRFTRSTTCQNNRFSFQDLPDGSWFVIAPVQAQGADRLVLMRRVQTRGGRPISIEL